MTNTINLFGFSIGEIIVLGILTALLIAVIGAAIVAWLSRRPAGAPAAAGPPGPTFWGTLNDGHKTIVIWTTIVALAAIVAGLLLWQIGVPEGSRTPNLAEFSFGIGVAGIIASILMLRKSKRMTATIASCAGGAISFVALITGLYNITPADKWHNPEYICLYGGVALALGGFGFTILGPADRKGDSRAVAMLGIVISAVCWYTIKDLEWHETFTQWKAETYFAILGAAIATVGAYMVNLKNDKTVIGWLVLIAGAILCGICSYHALDLSWFTSEESMASNWFSNLTETHNEVSWYTVWYKELIAVAVFAVGLIMRAFTVGDIRESSKYVLALSSIAFVTFGTITVITEVQKNGSGFESIHLILLTGALFMASAVFKIMDNKLFTTIFMVLAILSLICIVSYFAFSASELTAADALVPFATAIEWITGVSALTWMLIVGIMLAIGGLFFAKLSGVTERIAYVLTVILMIALTYKAVNTVAPEWTKNTQEWVESGFEGDGSGWSWSGSDSKGWYQDGDVLVFTRAGADTRPKTFMVGAVGGDVGPLRYQLPIARPGSEFRLCINSNTADVGSSIKMQPISKSSSSVLRQFITKPVTTEPVEAYLYTVPVSESC